MRSDKSKLLSEYESTAMNNANSSVDYIDIYLELFLKLIHAAHTK